MGLLIMSLLKYKAASGNINYELFKILSISSKPVNFYKIFLQLILAGLLLK